MRGLLSPTSLLNCQNLSPGSPSNKYFSSPSLEDSCSSLNYSQMLKSQTQSNKFYSFKKIKEQRIKQKNQQGKIVRQMIYKTADRKRERLKTLDDVKTIISHNSPRSSISVGKPKIQESIIIMRGKDLEGINDKDQQYFGVQTQPQTPCFKRRNTFTEEKMKQTDFLKPVVINPCTLRSIETGMIFHYQIAKMPVEAYGKICSLSYQGVLQIYSVIALKSCISHLSLILYEPYTETLSEKLLKSEHIQLKTIINYMIEIIKILSYLRNLCIYPQIEPTTVLLSYSTIKIKLRAFRLESEEMTQREVLRQFGYYFSSLINNLSKSRGGSVKVSRISGLSIRKRLELQNLMEQFIRYQEYNFDQAYLKLQAFQL